MDIAADLAMEAKLHTQTAGKSAVSGFRDFGGEFIKQLLGKGGNNNIQTSVTDDQMASMNSNDKALSDESYAKARAQVMAIYEEYRIKKLREEEEKKEKEKQESAQRMSRLRGETMASKQVKSQDIAAAMGKASAETGKSYGAE